MTEALRDRLPIALLDERMSLPKALADVVDERVRQIVKEGFTLGHDDQHDGGQLADAAACYAANAAGNVVWADKTPSFWPWEDFWWKPQDRRRDLVRGAALLLAEIERLDRAAAREVAA